MCHIIPISPSSGHNQNEFSSWEQESFWIWPNLLLLLTPFFFYFLISVFENSAASQCTNIKLLALLISNITASIWKNLVKVVNNQIFLLWKHKIWIHALRTTSHTNPFYDTLVYNLAVILVISISISHYSSSNCILLFFQSLFKNDGGSNHFYSRNWHQKCKHALVQQTIYVFCAFVRYAYWLNRFQNF